jgi:formate dehydrogenase subunit gamma
VKHTFLTLKFSPAQLLSILSIFILLSLISSFCYAYSPEEKNVDIEGIQNKNPGTDLWRQVRQRDMEIIGNSQVKNVESGVLINPQGDRWGRFRMETLIHYGRYPISAVVLLIIVFYLLRGKIKIEGGLSGRMVHRYSYFERALHWTLALVFIFLALTGLTLMFGRSVIIPVFGHEVFSLLASSSKEGHNLFGPLFAISVLLMFYQFVKRNIYEKGDLTWLLKGGGFLFKGHVTGGFFNMGEKTWYWIFILAGLAISVTGLILVFPNFGQGRVIMELSHVVHAICAIILITVAIGHMYLGSVIGTEGTYEAMKTGYVDIKWAEAHHDRWARECHEKNLIISQEQFNNLQGKSGNPSGSTSTAELETK